jgi:hypothetical protein
MMPRILSFCRRRRGAISGRRLICPAGGGLKVRGVDVEEPRRRRLAGVGGEEPTPAEGGYFERVSEVEEG